MSLGKRHGIVLDSKNQVFGWGDGTYGELGSSIKS
jgi:alpha-tubulin suppressor-like RCC1 family protein